MIKVNFKFGLIIVILFFNIKHTLGTNEFCSATNENDCSEHKTPLSRYILYDVNPPEGFNLRRDVYMRIAIFVKNLVTSNKEKLQNFKLVLPPWSGLYHWRSKEDNMHLPWSQFFDLQSLQKFIPVIEMYQFFNEIGTNYKQINIDEVYILQNYEDMFKTGNFEDKMSIEPCTVKRVYHFYEYENITSDNIQCLSFHGHASQLTTILEQSNSRTFLFHHAEIVLHDRYGDPIYWQARRSMRFNKNLRYIADEFRKKYLNSTNELDNTILPDDWTKETPSRNAKGGPYLCVHLRRRDFLWGRPTEVPDIDNAAKQIKNILKKNNLHTVFVATDAPKEEFNDLKTKLSNKYKVFKYSPKHGDLKTYKDGGLAIIEQIICSHAYYFVGTHESTFSFRIQEEREILGFPVERTFRRLCGNDNKVCEKPSVWKIVY